MSARLYQKPQDEAVRVGFRSFSPFVLALLMCGTGCGGTEIVTHGGLAQTLNDAGLPLQDLSEEDCSVAMHNTDPGSFDWDSNGELDLSFLSFRQLTKMEANRLFQLLGGVDTVKTTLNESCGCAMTVDFAIRLQKKGGDEFTLIVGVTSHRHWDLLKGAKWIDGSRITDDGWKSLRTFVLSSEQMRQNGSE
jgi:hypothetical protein